MRSGCVSSATSSTQASSFAWLVGAVVWFVTEIECSSSRVNQGDSSAGTRQDAPPPANEYYPRTGQRLRMRRRIGAFKAHDPALRGRHNPDGPRVRPLLRVLRRTSG